MTICGVGFNMLHPWRHTSNWSVLGPLLPAEFEVSIPFFIAWNEPIEMDSSLKFKACACPVEIVIRSTPNCSGIMHHQKHLRDLLLHIQMKRRISDFVCHNFPQSKTTSCAVPSRSPEKTNILSSLSHCCRGSVGHLWTLNFSGGIISSFWWRVTPSSNYLTVKK